MKILENFNLAEFNTFGVEAFADFFVSVSSLDELRELVNSDIFKNNKKLFLGGGSNILFTQDFNGLVIQNKLKGIEIKDVNQDTVIIKAMSGEIWDDLVTLTVERDFWGIENLALIPGTVGASPMQNIGAYGAEIKDTLQDVEVLDLNTGEFLFLSNQECKFGYRDSIFKNEAKGRYFIVSITLSLSKIPRKNVEYKVLSDYLKINNLEPNTSRVISEAVSNIRRSKLPDPKVIGNAGSFFKNTFVTKDILENLLKSYPDLSYFMEGENIKISSAWLIEHSGPFPGVSWKGYKVGDVGVHDKQALVLVNHGQGTGPQIHKLALDIIDSVRSKFGITLSIEVNLI